MSEVIPTDVKPEAGIVSPAPTGGQPDPKPVEPVQPTPAAEVKPGDPSPDVKQVPLPALQEERSKRQELEREISDLRKMVTDNQLQQIPQQQQPQVDPRAELEKLWEEDPQKAVRMEIMYGMDWRDRIDSSLEAQADALAAKYPDFNDYRSSSLGKVRGLPLNQRGAQGILEAAYFMVRGQNTDTIVQQRETELLEKYRRGEINAQGLATPPGSFSTPAVETGTVLNEEQLRVADAMGLTAEGYSSQMQIKK